MRDLADVLRPASLVLPVLSQSIHLVCADSQGGTPLTLEGGQLGKQAAVAAGQLVAGLSGPEPDN